VTVSPVDDRPDVSDMLVVHDAFRREYGMLPRLVRGVAPGDTERAAVLEAHYALLARFLHIHHHGEDVVLYPVLAERLADHPGLVDRMEAEHRLLNELLDSADAAVPRWAVDPTAVATEWLAALLTDVDAALEIHLSEEEREVLPLCEALLTRAEWDAVGEHSRAEIPQEHAFTILGMLLEDAPRVAGAHMLAAMPPPVSAMYEELGASAYAAYTAEVRATA
jgi:hemerythrin-like domain-containing protein